MMNSQRSVWCSRFRGWRVAAWFVATGLGLGFVADARVIQWYCNPGGSKQFSDGASLNASVRFELGVFTGSFVPTAANTGQWAANWQAAQRVAYNPVTGVFSGPFTVVSNSAPFTVGKRAYIWGFTPEYTGGEWILASDPAWNWPAADPLNPNHLYWDIATATDTILGSVNSPSPPYVLRTASVAVSLPPLTTWEQWHAEALAGEVLDGPDDDPDLDGSCNIEEYAHATDPRSAASVARVVPTRVIIGSDTYAALWIPRRPDRSLTTRTGRSFDLGPWDWSAAASVLVTQSMDGWTVRDVDPTTSRPRAFLRVRYTLP